MRDCGIWSNISFIFLILLISSASIAYLPQARSSDGVLYVPDEYPTIQGAVDVANPGDTIIVRDGTYIENVDVTKSVDIQSENGAEVTFAQAENPTDHVFEITADNVKISGFTAKGATLRYPQGKAGIYLSSSSNCNISYNKLLHNFAGIFLVSSSDNNEISNNNCLSNYEGIRLGESSDNRIVNNVCSLNTYYGIFLASSSDYNTILNNDCYSNGDSGICISGNNNQVSNNDCTDNNNGISLYVSNYNKISNNECTLNSNNGIHLDNSNNNDLLDNDCNTNFIGIRLVYSSNNNEISSNNCLNNGYGIFLASTDSNIIYLNNFADNGKNAQSYDSTIMWNSPEEITYIYNDLPITNYLGNYWKDYTGIDANGDGIGDTHYIIDSDNDNYPLMEPFEYYPTFLNLVKKYFPYYRLSENELYYPASFYFDENGELTDNHENYEKLTEKPPFYVYIHIIQDHQYFTIQYWLYYAHNIYSGDFPEQLFGLEWDHEHDWDSILFVILDKNSLTSDPVRVEFGWHEFKSSYAWSEISRDNTHPIVYVALGSHGAYSSKQVGLDKWNPPGSELEPQDFNWYLVGNVENCIGTLCKLDVEWIEGEIQPDPYEATNLRGYWPADFKGDDPEIKVFLAPWMRTQWDKTDLDRKETIFEHLIVETGEQIEKKVLVPFQLWTGNAIRKIIINTLWPGSDIDITAVDPNGIEYKGIQLIAGQETILVTDPIPGEWIVRVTGIDLPEDGEEVTLLVSFSEYGLQTPYELKQEPLNKLRSMSIEDKLVEKVIDKVANSIEKSLNREYWIDDHHLNTKYGIQVFNYEHVTVENMKLHINVWEKKGETSEQQEVIDVFDEVISKLVEGDKLLAEIAKEEAHETSPPSNPEKLKAYNHALTQTDKAFDKALEQINEDRPELAIISFKHAWKFAQLVIKISQ